MDEEDYIKKLIQDAFDRENGIRRLVLCCSCFNQEKKAKEALSVLFPEEVFPDVIKGRDRIYKFAIETGNEHIKALSKLTGRYAYYLEMNGNDIIKEYDLTTMRRIA